MDGRLVRTKRDERINLFINRIVKGPDQASDRPELDKDDISYQLLYRFLVQEENQWIINAFAMPIAEIRPEDRAVHNRVVELLYNRLVAWERINRINEPMEVFEEAEPGALLPDLEEEVSTANPQANPQPLVAKKTQPQIQKGQPDFLNIPGEDPFKDCLLGPFRSQASLSALVNDFIYHYQENAFPPPLLSEYPEDQKITSSQQALKDKLDQYILEYKDHSLDPITFLANVNKLCQDYFPKKDSEKHFWPRTALLFRSIQGWHQSHFKLKPPIDSMRQLLIVQQKEEAIAYFEKEKERLEHKGVLVHASADPEIVAKYFAYVNLINAIRKSAHDTSLNAILEEDSDVMRTPVMKPNRTTKELTEPCTLPGKPYATIQDVLAYHRGGRDAKPTSQRKLEKLRQKSVDPDLTLSDFTYQQKIDWLQNWGGKFMEMKDLILIKRPSKYFPKESRILEIDKSQADTGKKLTKFYRTKKRWKLDKQRPLSSVDISKKLGAKVIRAVPYEAENITKAELEENKIRYKEDKKALSEEIKLAQAKMPSTLTKDLVEDKSISLSVRGLAKGKPLNEVIKEQNALQKKRYYLLNGRQYTFRFKSDPKAKATTLKEGEVLLEVNEHGNIEYSMLNANNVLLSNVDTGIKYSPQLTNDVLDSIQITAADNGHAYYPFPPAQLDANRKAEVEEEIKACDEKILTKAQRIKICIAICRSLQELVHDAGLAHLDLKDKNILVDTSDPDDPKATVIDYDISEKFGKYIRSRGTPPYVPIELVRAAFYGPKVVRVTPGLDMSSLAQVIEETLIGSRTEAIGYYKGFIPNLANNLASRIHGAYPPFKTFTESTAVIDKHFKTMIENSKFDGTIHDIPLLETAVKPILLHEPVRDGSQRPPLDDLINTCEQARLRDQVETDYPADPVLQNTCFKALESAYTAAQKARTALRGLRHTQNKLDYLPIKTIIAKYISRINKYVSRNHTDPAIRQIMMKEFLHTLGLDCLKSFYAEKKKAGQMVTADEITAQVDKIFHEYENNKNYLKLNVIKKRDRLAMDFRYQRFADQVQRGVISLDEMAKLNAKNQATLLPYQAQIAKYEIAKQGWADKTHADKAAQFFGKSSVLDLQTINDHPIVVQQLLELPWMQEELKAFAKKRNIDLNQNTINEMLIQLFQAMAPKAAHNLLGEGRTYEMNLIYRAMNKLSTYSKAGLEFASLEQLLNYQQKCDVLEICKPRLIDLKKPAPHSKKTEAYQDLCDAIEAKLNDHHISVAETIGTHWIEFSYFTEKLKGIHLFNHSGDRFDKICHLPIAKNMLEKMQPDSKKQAKHEGQLQGANEIKRPPVV